jgi:hypothetical protein
VGTGYSSGTQWVDSFQGKGWSNSVSVAAYASFTQQGFYLDALAGYAYSNNQLQRQISIPGLQPRTANGSTGANQFLAQAEAGYKIGLTDVRASLLYRPAACGPRPRARPDAEGMPPAVRVSTPRASAERPNAPPAGWSARSPKYSSCRAASGW